MASHLIDVPIGLPLSRSANWTASCGGPTARAAALPISAIRLRWQPEEVLQQLRFLVVSGFDETVRSPLPLKRDSSGFVVSRRLAIKPSDSSRLAEFRRAVFLLERMARPSTQAESRVASLALAVIDLRAHFEAQLRAIARAEEALVKCRSAKDAAAFAASAKALGVEVQVVSDNNRSIRTVIDQMALDAGELVLSGKP